MGIPGYIILRENPHPDAVDPPTPWTPTLLGMVEESTGARGEHFEVLFFRRKVSACTNEGGHLSCWAAAGNPEPIEREHVALLFFSG